ncbi:hypothetical protein PGT21_030867 [Puccinia graminis f. sp. tritici]|uniref:Uncharacterized protein n=1 Tax=Puccinia graminis f. sp. tritici TaxID=56615 RepID=A0A5B0NHF2_PUCGR|nr:hypothetical protein PGT21_027406 [Puccinia graminis f. sp. tritici]KAA1087408.1 hypothetical protein PGT21_030867 [Puccinia graminis f. sp. tritici]KAA1128399.1 hypothetical protein PGTUg99_021111 [Puccinia graminis f. sp. tritici]
MNCEGLGVKSEGFSSWHLSWLEAATPPVAYKSLAFSRCNKASDLYALLRASWWPLARRKASQFHQENHINSQAKLFQEAP